MAGTLAVRGLLTERPMGLTSDRLEAVEKELRTTDLAFEEWEVLMREKLLVERSLLHVATGPIREPMDLTEVAPEEMGAARLHDVVDAPPDAGQEIRPRVNERR